LLTPADIRRLAPAAFEFLWRTILSREHGTSYRHVDGRGIDCLTADTAYQIYHHQGASWPVVQSKFRDDLHAAQRARAKNLFAFDEYVFVTTFAFMEPAQRAWLEARRSRALPLRVAVWGDERLCDQLARHPDLASQFGLGSSAGASAEPVELPPPALTILETLLGAPEETLTLAELRSQSGLDDPARDSDFKLALHLLSGRGFVQVIEPPGPSELLPEIRVLFTRQPTPSASGVPTATLLSAGKDYLAHVRDGLRHGEG
jgi:hypothetical protein